MTRVFESLREWREFRDQQEIVPTGCERETLGFVPTMGALHEGHRSLILRSKAENTRTLVSIFVNPTQFNDPEDLAKYPKTLDSDLKLLNEARVDYLLLPKEFRELYPDGYRYKVTESDFSQSLCGEFRPGHFEGVLTVVMKLLNLARADRAYFGEKDFQQGLLIQEMAEAFFLRTRITLCPTVRDQDGLALSSRNVRLTPDERVLAAQFPRVLKGAKTAAEAIVSLQKLGFKVDYVEDLKGRRYGAAHLGLVRLIDNFQIT